MDSKFTSFVPRRQAQSSNLGYRCCTFPVLCSVLENGLGGKGKKNLFTLPQLLTPRSKHSSRLFRGETMSHSCRQPRWCVNSIQAAELTPARQISTRGSFPRRPGPWPRGRGGRGAARGPVLGASPSGNRGPTSAGSVPGGLELFVTL